MFAGNLDFAGMSPEQRVQKALRGFGSKVATIDTRGPSGPAITQALTVVPDNAPMKRTVATALMAPQVGTEFANTPVQFVPPRGTPFGWKVSDVWNFKASRVSAASPRGYDPHQPQVKRFAPTQLNGLGNWSEDNWSSNSAPILISAANAPTIGAAKSGTVLDLLGLQLSSLNEVINGKGGVWDETARAHKPVDYSFYPGDKWRLANTTWHDLGDAAAQGSAEAAAFMNDTDAVVSGWATSLKGHIQLADSSTGAQHYRQLKNIQEDLNILITRGQQILDAFKASQAQPLDLMNTATMSERQDTKLPLLQKIRAAMPALNEKLPPVNTSNMTAGPYVHPNDGGGSGTNDGGSGGSDDSAGSGSADVSLPDLCAHNGGIWDVATQRCMRSTGVVPPESSLTSVRTTTSLGSSIPWWAVAVGVGVVGFAAWKLTRK